MRMAATGLALVMATAPAVAFEEAPGTTTWNAPADRGAWECAEAETMLHGMRPGPAREWLSDRFAAEGCLARMVRQEGATHQDPGVHDAACRTLGARIADMDTRDDDRASGFREFRRNCLEGATPSR